MMKNQNFLTSLNNFKTFFFDDDLLLLVPFDIRSILMMNFLFIRKHTVTLCAIDTMLSQGIVRPADSSYNSHRVAPKKFHQIEIEKKKTFAKRLLVSMVDSMSSSECLSD